MKEEIVVSELAKNFKPGIYKHFKGGIYDVLFVGRNSENRDEEFVVYRSLEKGHVLIRPIKMFFENVERDGYSGPRFVFLKNN